MKLNLDHINELVINNRYNVQESSLYHSRDFSGDYLNTEGLPALAIPGGDIGELCTLYAAANSYGFELDYQKTFDILLKIIGGEKFFSYHTIHKNSGKLEDLSCEYIQFICQNPEFYSLTKENIKMIEKQFNGIASTHLSTFPQAQDVKAGAVLLINGNYSLQPRFAFQMDEGMMTGTVYLFHRTLADKRNKILAQALIEGNAVKLFEGCDIDYLYTVLTETMDTHFFQAINDLHLNIPVYTVNFKENGAFDIEEG